jgi:hypothetical protein
MTPDREHPAAPEQVEHGFDEGVGRRPRSPAQRRVGRFGDRPDNLTDAKLRRPRFSEGIEQRPGSEENRAERRFSEGNERDDR